MNVGMNQARAQNRRIKAAAEIKMPDTIDMARGDLPFSMASSLHGG